MPTAIVRVKRSAITAAPSSQLNVNAVSVPTLIAGPPQDPEQEARDALVLLHLPQVQIVARRLAANLPSTVALSDLVAAGVLGLIDAVGKFDPTRNASLATYAQFRIRGAILDSLRSQDCGSRRLRLVGRRIADARHELSGALSRLPDEAEIAAHLNTTLEEYRNQLTESRRLETLSFGEAPSDEAPGGPVLDDLPSPDPNALEVLLGHEEVNRLIAAVDTLQPNERQVIALYYLEELTMREVGLAMGIGESRVSQIHHAALVHLKMIWDRRRGRRRAQ